jgi:predicted enzyme related to lactoylglutathione lyase
MPEITKYEPGMFCWVELATSDWKAAKRFYAALLGWSAEEMPMGPDQPPYVMLKRNGKDVCALYENPKARPSWLSYITVASADHTARTAKELGATVEAPPFDVMDAGRMTTIKDPQGARFAVWEARRHVGAAVRDEPNTLCWNELMTTDIDAARKFYARSSTGD